MALKKYILTIEFSDNGDNCEYVQEEVIDSAPSKTKTIYEVDVDDYFSDSDLACFMNDDVAKA